MSLKKATMKLELTRTNNNGYRHKYVCVKKESFKKSFLGFMLELGFEDKKIKSSFVAYEQSFEKDGEYTEKPRTVKVSELVDVCDHFQNKEYDVDVFYGVEKIFILVRVKGREKLVKTIVDKSKWKKFLKVSPRTAGVSVSNKQRLTPILHRKVGERFSK